MTPFMKLVADDLYTKMDGNFQNTTIIFPNKRASLFFSEYLWENTGGKTIWAPDYTTISDLFASLSRHTHADPIYLALRLFKVYKEVMQSDNKSIDQAYPLMEMMLSDFQDIDNNMVDPDKLFINIADLKEMTDFSFLTDEQRRAIEQFFGHFLDRSDGTSKLKSNFMTMWNNMTTIYQRFRDSLLDVDEEEKAMVYEGMMKRMVIDELTSENEETKKRIDSRLSATTYVVVGFNVLNKTEMELFKYLKEHRDTKFYWDYDEVYTRRSNQTKMQSKYEAGQFILEDIKVLGSEFKDKDENIYRNMQKHKKITFIQSPTDNAQTRYVDQWVRQTVKEDEPLRETAVILCDENLLQPVLHSIPGTWDFVHKEATPGTSSQNSQGGSTPNEASSKPLAVNVTMGYPLANTPIFSLVQALIDLQNAGTTISGSWRYKQASTILMHPLVQELIGNDCSDILSLMAKENIAFPGVELFSGSPLLLRIFRHVSGAHLADYLIEIITLVGRCYQHVSGSKDFSIQMQKEAIFTAYTCINRLRLIMEKEQDIDLGNETLSRLIIQLLSGASIPFHGEPVAGLQVMGLLETRNLDFRNIIMLSVSEGKMPKSDKRPSLIPYTLRAAFGMTTIEREVSLYAYYYYRLMQRADSITFVYNSSTEGGSKGEMSRFMLQTLAEADDLLAPGQEIETRVFTSESITSTTEPLRIEKTDEVMKRLNDYFNDAHFLSPSALNTYKECQLRFYLRYVARLDEAKEVSEDIDSSMFGTIFHYTMQKLYEPYLGKTLSSNTLEALINNDALIAQKINNAIAVEFFHYKEKDDQGNDIDYDTVHGHSLMLNGIQLINRHVIKEFVLHQLEADALMAKEVEDHNGTFRLLEMESDHKTKIEIKCDGDVAQLYPHGKKAIWLGGRIDRIDELTSSEYSSSHCRRIRIVDYKTSNTAQTAKNVASLFDKGLCSKNYHIFQTFYYATVLSAQGGKYAHEAIAPALMYCSKKPTSKNFSGYVKMSIETDDQNDNVEKKKAKSEDVTNFQASHKDEYTQRLFHLIKEIFSNGPAERYFTQCEEEDHCTYCPFLNICHRHPAKKGF